MRMSPGACRQRFAAARVARLATVSAAGEPHLVPVTFALLSPADLEVTSDGDSTELIVFAVDHKPKSTTALRRLDNIAANPRVAFLADQYDDDWTRLWWVRADGVAAVLAGQVRDTAIRALQVKYPQYGDVPPNGVVVGCAVERWSGWRASAVAD